jgi:hypothetical protein
MKNSELIKKLQALPQDMEVVIGDAVTNEAENDDCLSSGGLYTDFSVEKMTGNKIAKGSQPFIGLWFVKEEVEEPA